MKKTLIIISSALLILTFSGTEIYAGIVPPDSTIFPGLMGQQLMDSLYKYYKATGNLGYDAARDTIYGVIDKDADDSLRCIYSGFAIYMQPGQDPSTWAYSEGINCEHTWPQSSFSSAYPPVGDMHHLFATQYDPVNVNGDRSALPFRAIPDADVDYWYRGTTKTATAPADSLKYQYSRLETPTFFMPRKIQSGNTARAIFYFYNIYRPDYFAIETWWQGQLPYISDLLQWHMDDPADAAEIARTRKIATYQQGKKNPYVLDSTLVRRAYFPTIPTNTSVYFASVAITKTEGDAPFNIAVSIAIPSAGSATSVQVVLTGGTGTAADINDYTTQTLTFPAGSSANQNAVITITDDALVEGTETLIFRLRNVSGGTSAAIGADSVFTLTLGDNDDVTAPVIISGPTASGITSNSAIISWTTDEASNSWVYYGLTTSYTDTVKNESDVTNHSIGLSGLSASTTYQYNLNNARNNVGKCSRVL